MSITGRRPAQCLFALLGLLLAACQGQNIREQIVVPGTSELVNVQSVAQR